MIVFVAHQLGVSPATFADYALRDQTRRQHAVELQQHLRLRNFRLADWRACLQVGTNAAWATDRGEPIVQAMVDHLRAANVLLPQLRCWSGSDWRLGCVLAGRPLRPWRTV
jgi:hypothetical protein